MSTMMTVYLAPVLFRVASFSMLQALRQCRKEASEYHDNCYLALVLHFRVAPFCDSLESLPQDGILINIGWIMIVWNNCYVIAMDQ